MNTGQHERWAGMTSADRSWLLTRIATGTLIAWVCLSGALYWSEPALLPRIARALGIIMVVGGAAIVFARRAQPVWGTVVLVGGLVGLILWNAVDGGGGLASPGMQAVYLFVVIAGLLLGWRGAVVTALVVAVAGAWMALSTPDVAATDYAPTTRWLLSLLYLCIALFVVLAAERSQRRLLAATHAEARQLEVALEIAGAGRFVHDLKSARYRPDAAVTAMTGLVPDPDGTVPLPTWLAAVHPDDVPRLQRNLAPLFAGEADRARFSYRFQYPGGSLKHVEAALLLQRTPDGAPEAVTGLLLDQTLLRDTINSLGERLKEMQLLYFAAEFLRGDALDAHTTLRALVTRIPAAWQFPNVTEARLRLGALSIETAGWTGTGRRLEAPIQTSTDSGALAVEYRTSDDVREAPPFLQEEESLLTAVASLVASWLESGAERLRFRQIEARLQQAQRLEAVGTFASGIAHDFNNILAVVIGVAEAARDCEPTSPDSVREDLEQVIAAGRRGQALVQRIRRFGQREALDRRTVSLEALVREVVALARPSAPFGVSITVSVAEGMPDVWADASQIHQVLLNLLANGFHACQETGGSVTIRIEPGDTAGEAVMRVSDTGVGMPAAVAARIFEPFFTTKGAEGTGLGLSMVHGIIRDHDGSIQVHSTLGEGTTFEIVLPTASRDLSARSPLLAEPLETRLSPDTPRHGTVMMVDDDHRMLLMSRRILEEAGYTCVETYSPREAFDRFAAAPQSFSLLLSDMNMPELSGVELIQRLRAVRPDLPAVLCTGVDLTAVAPMLEQEGIHWVAKPPVGAELLRAVDRCVAEVLGEKATR